MKTYAVIVAGGSGQRMGTSTPKQFLPLNGKPVLWHTINAFFKAFNNITIILVVPTTYLPYGQELSDSFTQSNQINITEGGDSRYESVKNGLKLISDPSIVFVHDGVRCLVTPSLIRLCYETAVEWGNAVPSIPSKDSVRLLTPEGAKTINRNDVQLIQTPQTFKSNILIEAFQQSYQDQFTDEASVVETTGVEIRLVKGESENIKITTPIDMMVAQKLLESRMELL